MVIVLSNDVVRRVFDQIAAEQRVLHRPVNEQALTRTISSVLASLERKTAADLLIGVRLRRKEFLPPI